MAYNPRPALAALAAPVLLGALAMLACSPVGLPGLIGGATPTVAAAVTGSPTAPPPAGSPTASGAGTATPVTAATTATGGAGTPAARATRAAARTAAANPTGAANSTGAASSTGSAPASGGVNFVLGSTQKVCQLIGETDLQTNKPTTNQSETRWGLMGIDLGYSFEHDGKLFFTFGDSIPTRTFNGKPNTQGTAPRTADDDDAIAYTTDTSIGAPGSGVCPRLTFTQYANGAFKNPVVLGASGQPAITLRTNEVPLAGISDGGHLYVFFATDNPVDQNGGPSKGNFGSSTRSVVGVSDDDGNTFHYAYDFSQGPGARFVMLAPAAGQDGNLYFWGTQGGDLYRKSPPYLARKPVGSLGSATGLEYWHGLNADGTPQFMPGEANAAPLFHDTSVDTSGQPQTTDCMGEVGVTWNTFLQRWLMLYNCNNPTATQPRGIYMRTAQQPWGPWSAPQTIFNPQRDGGYCNFIHRAVTNAQAQCDNLAGPNLLGDYGGDYGPYVLNRYTTGDTARGTSIIDYTVSTWIPYTIVVLQSTLQRAS